MKYFHADGTPKSTNNAFFRKSSTDVKWLGILNQSHSGRANGIKRAIQMGSPTPEAIKRSATTKPKPKEDTISMEFIEAQCKLELDCLVWQRAFDRNNPIINRGGSGRDRTRIRKWIAENVLGLAPKKGQTVMMTCNTRGCCKPQHIATHNLERKL